MKFINEAHEDIFKEFDLKLEALIECSKLTQDDEQYNYFSDMYNIVLKEFDVVLRESIELRNKINLIEEVLKK